MKPCELRVLLCGDSRWLVAEDTKVREKKKVGVA